MSTNPFRHHTNQLFANRGCDIDAALAYANEVITAMPTEQHVHAMTALMVVVNTAANAFDQARGPSPEKLAILDLIRNEIDNWASSNLDDRIDSWVDSNLDVNDKIREYLEDNLDVDHSVNEWMNEYLESHISDAIDNLDLVVRTR
jgi:uncharacterized protein (UPF0262 family)